MSEQTITPPETITLSPDALSSMIGKKHTNTVAEPPVVEKPKPVENTTTEQAPVNVEAPKDATTTVTESTESKESTTETPAETGVTSDEQDAWWLSDGKTQPAVETQTEAKAEVAIPAEINVKVKTLDTIMEDADLRYLIEAKLSGKSIAEAYKDIQVTDYSTLPPADVIKQYGQMKGWSDEAIEQEIAELPNMRPSQIDMLTDDMRKRLADRDAGAKTNRTSQLSEEAKKRLAEREQQSQVQAQRQQAIDKRFQEEVKSYKQNLVGKPFFGAVMTQEDAEDFEKFVTKEFDFLREDGSYDVQRLGTYWLGAKKIQSIQKANYQTGKAEGTEKILKELHRPSDSSSAGVTKLPELPKPKSQGEKAMNVLDQIQKGVARITNS